MSFGDRQSGFEFPDIIFVVFVGDYLIVMDVETIKTRSRNTY